MTGQSKQFPNVHEVLNQSVFESRKEREVMVAQNFKLEPWAKEAVRKICEKHGTSPSKYFQKCAHALIKDYGIYEENNR